MADIDLRSLFETLEAKRRGEGLSWPGLIRAIGEQSRILNEQRQSDHPMSPATLRYLAEGRGVTCQHALFALRWLGMPPEAFIAAPAPGTAGVPLPEADAAHRLRWDLKKLYAALNAARIARGATWVQTAKHLRCTSSQLTGLRTAKYATGMVLAMRITQAMRRPAAEFIYAGKCDG